jgi:hypothetical protein
MQEGLGIAPWSTGVDEGNTRSGGLDMDAMELDQLRRD